MMQSSNQESEFHSRCLRHGVDFFAEKPVKEENLANVLQKLDFIKTKDNGDSE